MSKWITPFCINRRVRVRLVSGEYWDHYTLEYRVPWLKICGRTFYMWQLVAAESDDYSLEEAMRRMQGRRLDRKNSRLNDVHYAREVSVKCR